MLITSGWNGENCSGSCEINLCNTMSQCDMLGFQKYATVVVHCSGVQIVQSVAQLRRQTVESHGSDDQLIHMAVEVWKQ